jgi:hypothetical protein
LEGELPTEESSKDIAENWWNQPEDFSDWKNLKVQTKEY